MAIRLLPFRDYNEHDVVNLFKSAGNLSDFIDLSDANKRSTAQGDAGVFVTVSAGSLDDSNSNWNPVDLETNPTSLLGKTDYPHVGRNVYPQASLSVSPTTAPTDECVGITLRQTVARDENGENLLYNPVKKDELYGVLPGEAVPVLTRGLVTLTADALVAPGNVGDVLVPGADGKAEAKLRGAVGAGEKIVGTILAKGTRDDATGSQGGTNVFGDAGLHTGAYYIVKIDCA